MTVSEIIDADDVRLVPFTSLRDRVLRDALIPNQESVFVAEAIEMVRRAVATGLDVSAVLTDSDGAEQLSDLFDSQSNTVVLVAPRSIIERISGLGVHRGALGLVRRPPLRLVTDVIANATRMLILETVNNPVNVGLVARSAAAFGVDGLLIDAESSDPLYRRAVSASRGATMGLPWARGDSAAALVDEANAAGFTTIALTLGNGAVELQHAVRAAGARVALVLGNEGSGLTATTEARCTWRATIPMTDGPFVDSLNVASAAAVALYEVVRAEPRESEPR